MKCIYTIYKMHPFWSNFLWNPGDNFPWLGNDFAISWAWLGNRAIHNMYQVIAVTATYRSLKRGPRETFLASFYATELHPISTLFCLSAPTKLNKQPGATITSPRAAVPNRYTQRLFEQVYSSKVGRGTPATVTRPIWHMLLSHGC